MISPTAPLPLPAQSTASIGPFALPKRSSASAVAPGEPYYTQGCVSAAQCVLPGAQIPRRAWSAPAIALLPCAAPAKASAQQHLSSSSRNQTLRDDKGAIVSMPSRAPALSAYYFADDYHLDNPIPPVGAAPTIPASTLSRSAAPNSSALALTTTLSPSAINELRFGYAYRQRCPDAPLKVMGPTLASQGFVDASGKPGIVALSPRASRASRTSPLTIFTIGVDITGVAQANNTYQWSDDFSSRGQTHVQIRRRDSLPVGEYQSECDVQRVLSLSRHVNRIGFRGLPARHRQ